MLNLKEDSLPGAASVVAVVGGRRWSVLLPFLGGWVCESRVDLRGPSFWWDIACWSVWIAWVRCSGWLSGGCSGMGCVSTLKKVVIVLSKLVVSVSNVMLCGNGDWVLEWIFVGVSEKWMKVSVVCGQGNCEIPFFGLSNQAFGVLVRVSCPAGNSVVVGLVGGGIVVWAVGRVDSGGLFVVLRMCVYSSPVCWDCIAANASWSARLFLFRRIHLYFMFSPLYIKAIQLWISRSVAFLICHLPFLCLIASFESPLTTRWVPGGAGCLRTRVPARFIASSSVVLLVDSSKCRTIASTSSPCSP